MFFSLRTRLYSGISQGTILFLSKRYYIIVGCDLTTSGEQRLHKLMDLYNSKLLQLVLHQDYELILNFKRYILVHIYTKEKKLFRS